MENRSLLEITVKDVQWSAKYRLGRELTNEEINDVERYLRIAFEDWGNVLGEFIERMKSDGDDISI